MAYLNKIFLIGNLTRDPQLSYLPSQTPVVEFGLAINRRWRGQEGQEREETCFVDCRAYGRQAETLNKYVQKGKTLFIEGRLHFDAWEAQDGTKRSKHRVVIDNFQFLGPPTSGAGRAGQQRGAASRPAPAAGDYEEPGGDAEDTDDTNAPSRPGGATGADDDVPF